VLTADLGVLTWSGSSMNREGAVPSCKGLAETDARSPPIAGDVFSHRAYLIVQLKRMLLARLSAHGAAVDNTVAFYQRFRLSLHDCPRAWTVQYAGSRVRVRLDVSPRSGLLNQVATSFRPPVALFDRQAPRQTSSYAPGGSTMCSFVSPRAAEAYLCT
jgi:hypothetical protein